jgi:hypothetical protein
MYPASLEQTDPSEGFAYVLYVDAPAGQMSWHIADSDLDLFEHVPRDVGRRWDGSVATYHRLSRLTKKAQAQHLRVTIDLHRLPGRARCPACGRRRVLFTLAANTPSMLATVARGRCAECAGMRT